MATVRNLHLPTSFMTIINKAVKLVPNLSEIFYVYNENVTKVKISGIMADKYNTVGMCTSGNYAQDESVNFIINIFICLQN
jgi:hypothetical protein